jgi:hypothetical protein
MTRVQPEISTALRVAIALTGRIPSKHGASAVSGGGMNRFRNMLYKSPRHRGPQLGDPEGSRADTTP